MPDDKVRRIADESLDQLAQALAAGKSDALKDYLALRPGSTPTAGITSC